MTDRLSSPPFIGPTDKAAHFQRHPIPGQGTLFSRYVGTATPHAATCGCDRCTAHTPNPEHALSDR